MGGNKEDILAQCSPRACLHPRMAAASVPWGPHGVACAQGDQVPGRAAVRCAQLGRPEWGLSSLRRVEAQALLTRDRRKGRWLIGRVCAQETNAG